MFYHTSHKWKENLFFNYLFLHAKIMKLYVWYSHLAVCYDIYKKKKVSTKVEIRKEHQELKKDSSLHKEI